MNKTTIHNILHINPLGVGGARRGLLLAGILATAAIAGAGCKGTLGTDTVNVSGSVFSGGKLIGGSLTINSNTLSVGGSVASGSATNSGGISVGL